MPLEPPYVLSLDAAAAQEPGLVGAQIALLARARALGLPVLRGRCVTGAAYEAACAGVPEERPALAPAQVSRALPQALAAALADWSRSFAPLRVRGFSIEGDAELDEDGVVVEGVCGPEALQNAVRRVWWQLATAWPPTRAVAVLVTDDRDSDRTGRARSCVPGAAAGGAHLVEVDGHGPLVVDAQALVVSGDAARAGMTRGACEQLVQLLNAAGELVGDAVDLEWSLRRGRVWIARLRPQQHGVHRVEHLGAQAPGLEVWSSFSLREDLRRPLTPLSFGLWRDELLPVVFESLTGLPGRATRERRMLPVDCVSGRLYWNANRLLATPVGALLLRVAPRLDRHAGALLMAACGGEQLQPPALSSLRKLWALGWSLLGLAGVVRRALGGLRIAAAVRDSRRFAAQQLRAAAQALDQLDDQELLQRMGEATQLTRAALRRGLARELLGVLGLHAVRALWPQAPIGGVGRHGAGVAPGAVVVELRRLAARLRAGVDDRQGGDPTALQLLLQQDDAARAQWDALLAQSGHRAVDELELAAPRWREEPALLWRALEAAAERPDDAPRAFDLPGAAHGIDAGGEASAPLWGQRWLSALVGRLLLMRDFPRWAFAAGLFHLRCLYLEAGRRLTQRQLIAAGDDVFLLRAEEVRDLLLGLRRQAALVRTHIEQRRHQLQGHLADQPPDVLRSDGLVPQPEGEAQAGAEAREGIPAAGGRALAPVRVVDVAGAAAAAPRGEVLVAASMTPGWAPLLAGAVALVTEAGDWASHAAAMAREAGLPAVVGVAGATRWLRSGDRICVDGDRGRVELLQRTSQPS